MLNFTLDSYAMYSFNNSKDWQLAHELVERMGEYAPHVAIQAIGKDKTIDEIISISTKPTTTHQDYQKIRRPEAADIEEARRKLSELTKSSQLIYNITGRHLTTLRNKLMDQQSELANSGPVAQRT